jgi:putative ABC transport system ATP-binding protein
MLIVKHLMRSTADSVLLDDISCALAAGQRVALTGANGSGKSLLLRSLVFLDAVDQGQVLFNNRPVTCDWIREFRTHVMYVPQRCVLLAASVRENLLRALQLSVHAQPTAGEAEASGAVATADSFDCDQAIAELGFSPELLDRDAKLLSGGELQVINLLRALQLNPQVLLLDEPTAAMDAATTQRVEEWLHVWLRANPLRAWIWVSHDPLQTCRIADTVWRMDRGHLITDRTD